LRAYGSRIATLRPFWGYIRFGSDTTGTPGSRIFHQIGAEFWEELLKGDHPEWVKAVWRENFATAREIANLERFEE
jgi:hypothetical protein